MRKRGIWKDYFRGKLLLQVFSVLVALGLWIFVNSGQQIEEKRSVKIQYTRMPSTLTFEKSPLKEVAIGLSGPLYRLRALTDDDLTYLVDLSGAKPGSNRVELTLDALRLPLDLEATLPNPRVFYVYLEEVNMRELPVRAQFSGQLKAGLSITKVGLNPVVVTVEGPKSVLSKLEFVPLEISLEGRSASFNVTIKPKINAPSVEVRESVYAEIEIAAVKRTKEFENVPVTALGSDRVSIEPGLATVLVEGAERDVQTLSWQPQVVVDVKDLKRGRYLLRGRVEAPASIRVLEIRPLNFRVEILQ